ncbi:MAG: selenocysteine-specific translation elongation factor [Leptothrix sp. (in: Bacteria)]|nr:selenocysteine-specific translation elongation factor [Leptothrix sp. (in: b-proteobacteria)]
MIIGTAGHIDHGKTSLVKALTGIDADRLKEEKERGITVDLGFAYHALPDGEVLGFVDVPGHEKLVRNMLAGATGIDHVLLVIAADDGPMPQTREHLAILHLLGLGRGAVALSKCDLVTPARLAEAEGEVRTLLAGSALADAPILPVSSRTGAGLPALQAHLAQAAAQAPAARRPGQFRLAVDRSFTLAGIGTVVTGTAVSGQVAVGDKLTLSPRGLEVRVRGLHAQSLQAATGRAGQRLALNLAGVEKNDVRRGDWIVADALHAPTQRLDVRLQVLASETRPLAHWTPVHLHLGAEDVGARVVLLEGQAIEPGRSALVQLDLDRAIGALHGDRFILRDQSALRTLGGGVVLDAFPPVTRRRRAQRLATLAALAQPGPAEALAAALALELPGGVDARQFATLYNLDGAQLGHVMDAAPHRSIEDGGRALLFASGQIERYAGAVSAHLAGFHRKQPDSPGLTQEALQRAVRDKPAGAVFALLLRQLVKEGALKRSGPHLSLAGHDASLQGAEKALWERLKPWLDEGGVHPPRLSEMLLRDRSLRKDQVMRVLQRLERMGKVHAVGAEYFIQTPHLLQLAAHAHALAEADEHKRLNVKALREATGISRHLSVPLVEYFDQIGLTKRDDLGRHFRRDPRKVFEG